MADAPLTGEQQRDAPSERAARWCYSAAWVVLLPLMLVYLLYRGLRAPGYRRHWGERLGWYRRAGMAVTGPLIWIHAVSLGETRALQPLVRQLQQDYPGHQLLITATTPTGRAASAELYGNDGVMRCYLPYDFPWCINRFLDYFCPAIGILMETELWPNLLACADKRKVPIALVNARLSGRSLRKGQRFSPLIRPALKRLSLVVAQTDADKARLQALGRKSVVVAGNLKFDVLLDDVLLQTGRRWREAAGQRPVVLLASSRDGEEAPVLNAWVSHEAGQTARARNVAGPALLIVPRHPERFGEVAGLVAGHALQLARRSEFGSAGAGADTAVTEPVLTGRPDCILGDSMGEMPAYYAMADLTIMGGSLLPFGGQNLIESCAAGVPVILGPHTYNFEQAAEQAIACGAALRVSDASEAVHTALTLLGKPGRLATMRAAAEEFARAHRGATQRTLVQLAPLLAVPGSSRSNP